MDPYAAPSPPAATPQPAPPAQPPAEASPEAAQRAADEAMRAQTEAIAAAAPPISGGVADSVLRQLRDVLNTIITAANALMADTGQAVPLIAWEPPKGEWTQPLPRELWLPLVGLAAAAQQLQGGTFAALSFDPMKATTSGALRQLTAKLDKLARNKAFLKALAGAEQGEPAPTAAPGQPSSPADLPPEDELLAAAE